MENKNEILKGLYELKTNLLNRKVFYENKLSIINSEIGDINKEICKYEGHDFGEWYDGEEYYFGYIRTCSRCNEMEYTNEKPKTLKKK